VSEPPGSLCSRLGAALRAGLAFSLLLIFSAEAADAPEFGRGLREYYHGDHAVAAEIWRTAAEAGDAKSQSSLGFLYLFGFGVPKDLATAVHWYKKAADQDEPEAQAFLGTFYVEGRGVERNLVQGLKWCELAVWHGASRGMGCRSNALRQMNSAEMREGWRLFNEWLEQHPRVAQR
jgi:TPR repeat protein